MLRASLSWLKSAEKSGGVSLLISSSRLDAGLIGGGVGLGVEVGLG